jgi:hypothetical protein
MAENRFEVDETGRLVPTPGERGFPTRSIRRPVGQFPNQSPGTKVWRMRLGIT